MKLLLVDLDDTLIDTSAFKESIFANLATKHVISPDLSHKIYEEIKQATGVHNWLTSFTSQLAMQTQIDAKDIEGTILATMQNISVNAAVLRFVKAFEGYKVIFSQGEDSFQRKKIEVAQLHLHVDEVITTQEDKFTFLSTFIHGKEFILHNKNYSDVTVIDNLNQFLERINVQFPWIHTLKTAAIPA